MKYTAEKIESYRKWHKECEELPDETLAEVNALCDLALRGLNAGDQWRGIESAPKDGTRILAAIDFADGYQIQTVFFGEFHPNSRGKSVWREAWSNRPVHDFDRWQPRPAPPAMKEKL